MRKFVLTGLAVAALLPAAAQAQNRPAPASTPAPAAAPARPAAAPAPAPAQAQVQAQARQQQSAIPQAAGLIVLIKSSLIALNQANQTGNYQVLYALGSDGLRSSTNPQNLAQSFAAFRERRIDLSPVLVLAPRLTRAAAIEGGRLHLVGSFPTTPLQINFDFWFEPSQGQWKFVQLNTSLTPVPAQGQPQPQQQHQPQQQPQQQRR
ncbi:MAG: hypothetical protein QM676_00510 [Novosphingobium sp.]